MEGRDMEEMLGWPLELLHVPTQRRDKRRKQGAGVDVEGHGEGEGGDRGVVGQRDSMTVHGWAAGAGGVGQGFEFGTSGRAGGVTGEGVGRVGAIEGGSGDQEGGPRIH
jgi:hypothetical protein